MMDRREVFRILNGYLEKCENFMQDLDSAFKETESWTESLRKDVKRLMKKETEIGLIMPTTPAACSKLGRCKLSVINECDAVENGENFQPKNEKPTNQLVTSSVPQDAPLLSSSNKENADESRERSQRKHRKNEKSLPMSEDVQKAKISDPSKRSPDESQVSVSLQDERVSNTQSKRKHSSRERCSKLKEEAELAEETVPNVPELIQLKKDGRLTRSKYSNQQKNRCTRSLHKIRSTYVVDNESSLSENNSGEAMLECDDEVPKKRSKRTFNMEKSTFQETSNEQSDDHYEETSTKRKSSCLQNKCRRVMSKSHCKKNSRCGKKSEMVPPLGSDRSLLSSSSGNENDQSSTEKNDDEAPEKIKENKETQVIDFKEELHSGIQSNNLLPSSLDDDSEERKTFIIRASPSNLEICKRIENEPCYERNTMTLDESSKMYCADKTEPCVSDSPIVDETSSVKEHKCSSAQRDSSKRNRTGRTNFNLVDSPSSARRVIVETEQDNTVTLQDIKGKSPKKLGMKKGKRNDVEESNLTESPENSDIKFNSEVQNNCVVILHDFMKVSQHSNDEDKNVQDDKKCSEKEDSKDNGTDSCGASAANLDLTSSEEIDESHSAVLEVENPSKNMLVSSESGFVSPTDTLKGQKTNQNMNIVRANEIIKTGKRVTRSKARAVAGLGSKGVPVLDLKATTFKKDNTYFQKCARTSIKKAIKTLTFSQKHADSKENCLVSLSKKLVNHTSLTSKVLSDVNISSSSVLNTSKKTPLTGPLFNFGSTNKLIKSTAKPGVILCNTETFIKKKTKPVVPENKEEELKKRQEKENDAQRRREELLKKKIEDKKKKKEEQRLKVLQKREALEKEKLLLQERVEKDREVKQKDNQLKKKLELEKKAGVKRKIEETATAKAKQKQEELQHKALDSVPMEMVNCVEEETNAPVSSDKIENKKLTVVLASKHNLQKIAPEVCNLNTTWTEPISTDLNTTWVKPAIPSVSKTVNSTSNVKDAGNNAYFLDDLMSDDSGEENESLSHKKPARWAKRRSKLLHESLLEMHLASKIRKVLACQNQPIKINEMFPNKRLLRTSSAKWDTPPRYSKLPHY